MEAEKVVDTLEELEMLKHAINMLASSSSMLNAHNAS